MGEPVHLAISTCPNDTYAFSGLLSGEVATPGLDLRIELLDIAELNRRLLAGEFDVAKASFHAALYLTAQTCVLPVGSALGFGVGPLLLAAAPNTSPEDAFDIEGRPRVLCPGPYTTATMLYRMFHPTAPAPEHAVFSDIMPALSERSADFGVCIHEGRFTWEAQGLHLVEDLGTRWESEGGGPLPLGGILARRRLGVRLHGINDAIAQSIAWADAHRDGALRVMRAHAQEMDDAVMWGHVELYVNEWTRDLGDTGRGALQRMYEIARDAGVISSDARELSVL